MRQNLLIQIVLNFRKRWIKFAIFKSLGFSLRTVCLEQMKFLILTILDPWLMENIISESRSMGLKFLLISIAHLTTTSASTRYFSRLCWCTYSSIVQRVFPLDNLLHFYYSSFLNICSVFLNLSLLHRGALKTIL